MTCKDCIHYEACEWFGFIYVEEMADDCLRFKPKSRFIESPCKVGDTLYVISRMKDNRILPFISQYEATSIAIKKKSIVVYHEMDGYIKLFKSTDFGKTVFLTKEEAEKALEERNKK
jgi:hypothetical protein